MNGLPEWERVIDRLRPIGARMLPLAWHPDDPRIRQELARALMSQLVHAYVGELHADPDYPEFVAALGLFLNVAAPVPDFMYQGTPVRGDATYRIAGTRGTSRFVDISALAGYWPKASPDQRRLATYDLDELELAPDGSFEVILSNERPSGHTGNWWQLHPETIRLNARRASYDWLNEVDARLTIERLDIPARRPRPDPAETAVRIGAMVDWVETAARWWLEHLARQRASGRPNELLEENYGVMGSPRGQVYLEGVYELAQDEALLIECRMPESCRYWSLMVTDELFVTLDWMHRFSSINGHQAQIGPDGVLYAVISAQDPGVPNWIDTGDYPTGLIQMRWNNANKVPMVEARKIPMAELAGHIPAHTPRVTPDERDALLRLRRKGAQLRQVW